MRVAIALTSDQIDRLYAINAGQHVFPVEDEDIEFLYFNGYISSNYLPPTRTERDKALDLKVNPTLTECALLPKGQQFLDDLERAKEQRLLNQRREDLLSTLKTVNEQATIQTDLARKQNSKTKLFLEWTGLIVGFLALLAAVIIPFCR